MKLWSFVVAALLTLNVHAGNWDEGKHFKIANPAGKSAQPTVVEVFSYGCPVCFRMEANIGEWKKVKPAPIKFVRIPHYGVHDEGEWLIKMFYTAEVLGFGDKIHMPLFEALHVQRKHIHNENEAVAFLLQFGQSDKVIREALTGFAVMEKVRVAKDFVHKFRINTVPTFIINDKFVTDGAMGRENLFNVINDLALR